MGIIKQENVDVCKDKIQFSFDAKKVGEVINKLAVDIGKNYKLPGSRKGKASIEAVKIHARKYLLNAAKDQLIQEAVKDILFENKWKSFGSPEVKSVNISMNTFSVEMILGRLPEIELKQYKDFQLEEPTIPGGEFIRQSMVDNLCEKHGEIMPFKDDDFVLLQDSVVINYNATIDGKEFDGGKAENVMINVGSNMTIGDLENQMVGMRVGETREIEAKFDDDYRNKNLAGQKAKFVVTLVSASRRAPAEFNENLAKIMGFDSIDKLNEKIDADVVQYLDDLKHTSTKGDVVNKLLEANAVDLPEWMIIQAAESMASNNNQNWQTLEDDKRKEMIEQAKKAVKLSVLFDKIREQEPDTNLSDDETMSLLDKQLGQLHPSVRNALFGGGQTNMSLLSNLFKEVQNDHLLKWIAKNSTIVAKVEENKEIANG